MFSSPFVRLCSVQILFLDSILNEKFHESPWLFRVDRTEARQHTQNKCAAHFLWLVILLIYSASGHLQIVFFRTSPSPGSIDDAINLSVERKMYVGEYGEDTKNDNLFID